MLGRVLGGRYRVERCVGQGGFGTVYRGVHLHLGDAVAIKTVSTPHGDLVTRFNQEARLQRRLRHPVTVRLLDFGIEPDGLHYMVQEFVEGRTLKAHLRDGPLRAERVVPMAVALLEALEEAHGFGIVHRDLKSANIMLTAGLKGEEVRLLDFGIAKLLDQGAGGEAIELTRPGQLIGSVHYMSPEQIGSRPVGPWTDVYQLGCVMYEALRGQRPFTGQSLAVIEQHLKTRPAPLPPSVPAPVAAVVRRALAKAPGGRFPSAREMRIALLETRLAQSDTDVRLATTGEAAQVEAPPADAEDSTTEQDVQAGRPPFPGPPPVPGAPALPTLSALSLHSLPDVGRPPADRRPRPLRPTPVGDPDATLADAAGAHRFTPARVEAAAGAELGSGFDFERTGPSFAVPDLGAPLPMPSPSTDPPTGDARADGWKRLLTLVALLTAALVLAVAMTR